MNCRYCLVIIQLSFEPEFRNFLEAKIEEKIDAEVVLVGFIFLTFFTLLLYVPLFKNFMCEWKLYCATFSSFVEKEQNQGCKQKYKSDGDECETRRR